jgi:hypothetical protein
MAVGIGAAGSVGIARESVAGTYAAPEVFIPVRSEGLKFINEVQYTRPIMGTPDQIHGVTGPQRVEGDIEFEVLLEPLLYLLYGARMDLAKTGTGPYVYTFTPSPAAEAPNKTLSITVVRNGVVFGYVGCVVGKLEFTTDNGVLVCTATVLGRSEAPQSSPSISWPEDAPFDADAYTLTIGGSGVTDADQITWSLDDSAEAVNRLGVAAAAAYVKFGERTVTASMERDFQDATEYNKYKSTTEQALTFKSEYDANNYILFTTQAVIMSTFEVNLSGQGDLVRGSIDYMGKYDFTSGETYEIEISSDTIDIT